MFKNFRFFILIVISAVFIFSNSEGLFSQNSFKLPNVVKDNTNNEQKYEEYGRKKGGKNSKPKYNGRTKKGTKDGQNIYKYN